MQHFSNGAGKFKYRKRSRINTGSTFGIVKYFLLLLALYASAWNWASNKKSADSIDVNTANLVSVVPTQEVRQLVRLLVMDFYTKR